MVAARAAFGLTRGVRAARRSFSGSRDRFRAGSNFQLLKESSLPTPALMQPHACTERTNSVMDHDIKVNYDMSNVMSVSEIMTMIESSFSDYYALR